MPNLPMHIYLANQVAEELDWGSVYDHIGSFYLGSTSPDIRAMTKWPREQTHFAPLSVSKVGTGTRTMFENYPELLDEIAQSPATRSFSIGLYLPPRGGRGLDYHRIPPELRHQQRVRRA